MAHAIGYEGIISFPGSKTQLGEPRRRFQAYLDLAPLANRLLIRRRVADARLASKFERDARDGILQSSLLAREEGLSASQFYDVLECPATSCVKPFS